MMHYDMGFNKENLFYAQLPRIYQRYLKILVVSFAIAVPIAYVVMEYYYDTFAYRAPLRWWVFALAFIVVTLITVIIVTLCCYQSATTNPAESLKNE